MRNTLSRRGFVKGVGLLMGAAGIGGCGIPKTDDVKNARFDANGLTLRKRGHKYPWWVKTVDQMTTELDPAKAKRPGRLNAAGAALMSNEKAGAMQAKAKAKTIEGITNNTPGRSLPDYALQNAAQGYMTKSVGTFDNKPMMSVDTRNTNESWFPFTPQSLGLPAWEASPEEASKVVTAAGIQLGASQVGFTTLNPDWLYNNITFDPEASTHESNLSGKRKKKLVLPTSYKYCVALITQGPRDLLIRNQSALGGAGDRAAYARIEIASTSLIRFIKALGFNAISMLTSSIGPVIPHAIKAGLGELGRMNRMISPIYGGNIRIDVILTDLPLAIDKPIDFGLQKFCKNCKVCATACPSGALSLADEPYWTPANAYSAPGKKTYFEDSAKCAEYFISQGTFCSTCLSVCPWSKMDKTALHDISKVLSSQIPAAGNFLKKMDESFGYGLVKLDSPEMADWWDLDIPEQGIDSFQGMEERS